MRKLCVIPGDGIGQEVIPAAVEVLEKVMPSLEFVEAEAGWNTFNKTGKSVPQKTIDTMKETGAGLFGAVSSPSRKVEGYQSAILTLRKALGLYANIRPIKSELSPSHTAKVDMTIVRENSEGLYVRQESYKDGKAVAKRVITEAASRRIGQKAFEICKKQKCKRITIIHKANVLPITDGLFLRTIKDNILNEALSNSIQVNDQLVDSAALKIMQSPDQFDVVVTTNLYGDILSDLASYWCGGLGFAPSINMGDEIAIAEPVHGSAPDIAGMNVANPIAAILSAALLLSYQWNERIAAEKIETAVKNTIKEEDFFENGFIKKGINTSDIAGAILQRIE